MRSRLRYGDQSNDPEANRIAVLVVTALCLSLVGAVVLSIHVPSSPGPLTGTWTGRDASGGEIYYHFGDDERGYRVVEDTREEFGYTLEEGYPNELHLRVSLGGEAATYRAVVDFWKAGHLRLELGGRGDPRPDAITAGALELRRVPTR
jgi:hypothetical protein